ncbi:MAG: F-type H+-transporting ATPase subunit a, partial [Streptomyces sp.]|nr:F-type H+-transporting ATPase subunit a [Streptomyces sp.]
MSDVTTLASETNCHIFEGCGFPAPGLQNFVFKPLFSVGSFDFNKPML